MEYNKAIDQFISYCFEPHEVEINKERHDSIFWVKNDEIIAEIENSKYFWLRYDIWNSISRMFELKYSETQSVIRTWLEKHYNLGKLTPRRMNLSSFAYVGTRP
jgi:hypothetical protein